MKDCEVSVESKPLAALGAAQLFERVLALACLLSIGITARAAEDLEAMFKQPPAQNRPWVHWQWVDGNISREGITADLEAMARVGIGGAILLDASAGVPRGPVRFGTPEWVDLVHHSAAEAARLGLELGIHSSPGYTGLGGPWITPETSSQKLVWSITNVSGPMTLEAKLPDLPSFQGYNSDVAVLAFPSLLGDGGRLAGRTPKLQTSLRGAVALTNLVDESPGTTAKLPVATRSRSFSLQVDYASPYTASRLRLSEPPGAQQKFAGVLQASFDGRRFSDVRDFRKGSPGEMVINFHEVTARSFRLVFTWVDPALRTLSFNELDLSPVHEIPRFQAKSGIGRGGEAVGIPPVPRESIIPLERVLNLSTQFDTSKVLRWNVPPGKWTILRLGSMPVGRHIPSARPEALGLEGDRLNRDVVTHHVNSFLDPLLPAQGTGARRAVTLAHMDSWESGFQNWTGNFQALFQQRRGYDPLPWLPTFTGRVVQSPEETERFLWDVRRTIADLFATEYAEQLAHLAHERGLQLSLQSYFNGPFDDLQYGARADVASTEFWNETDEDSKFEVSKYMASVAHTTGKRVVSAEAFTAWPVNGSWQNHPGSLKLLGDRAFCEGVNHFVFHRYAHQPWQDCTPGMTFGMWGIHYERTQTWWEFSAPWHEYLSRCQTLLRAGLYVADLLYLTPEGAYTQPPGRQQLHPVPPDGYHYDVVHPEVVLAKLQAKDGKLTLPDGMSYRVLILPSQRTMTPALLRTLTEVVAAGAVIFGPKPLKSPSLSGFPDSDQEVLTLAEKLWGSCDGEKITRHAFGKGVVYWGRPLTQVLEELRVPPDFLQVTKSASPVRFIHRAHTDADVYFLATPSQTPISVECSFRVRGRRPELWNPEHGTITPALAWRTNSTHTFVRVPFNPVDSVFVVFRETLEPAYPSPRSLQESVSVQPVKADGPWSVQFQNEPALQGSIQFPALLSWNKHPNTAVKYFSGVALYRTTVQLPSSMFGEDRRMLLNLGDVQVIARAHLNGREFPPVWKKPFVVDVTSAAAPGENVLEVEVANLWANRLIGDEQYPEDAQWRHLPPGQTGTGLVAWPEWFLKGSQRPTQRKTFASWKFYSKDSPLLPSGLLGPVTFSAVH